jgi:hypothetical protein
MPKFYTEIFGGGCIVTFNSIEMLPRLTYMFYSTKKAQQHFSYCRCASCNIAR